MARWLRPRASRCCYNGVLVQNNTVLKGGTTYIGAPNYVAHGDMPLRLQDHGHLVRFRNIWLRKL